MRNDLGRIAAVSFLALVGLAVASCETRDSLSPDTGGVFVILRDSSLGFQSASEAKRQITVWRADALKISFTDHADYPILPNGSCSIFATGLSDGNPGANCGGSALTLEATGAAREAIVRLDLSAMETFSARRPSLPDDQDYDGDGVRNRDDNCKIVSNADQEVFGVPFFGQPGIACAADDGDGNPLIPDQDNDGVRDSFDNCLWYPNPILPGETSQHDANLNGIGDLCEVASPIPFAGVGRLSLECPGTFTVRDGAASLFVVDFTSALACDANYGVCTLDRTKVTMRLSTEDAAAARPCVDVSDQPAR